MSVAPWGTSRSEQSITAMLAASVLVLLICISPMLCVVPLFLPLILAGYMAPHLFCLGFYAFSVFRLHEVIPPLFPLKIPLILAILGILSIGHALFLKKIKLYWCREMTYFFIFFVLISIGVPLSYNVDSAYSAWSDIFVKICLIFFMIAWTIRDEKAISLLIKITVSCGVFLSLITLYNKHYGINLVEGTRATINFGLSSSIADPNDLSLILLFPFSFSCSLFATQSNPRRARAIGLISLLLIMDAIFATQSRGGLLGLAGVMMYFFSIRIRSKSVLVSLGLLAIIIIFIFAGISTRASGGSGQGIDESSMGRIHAWEAAMNMAFHHPFFGVGLNGFVDNFYQYALVWDNAEHAVHSSWFEVLSESGFPGLFLFLYCVYLAIKSSRSNIHKIKQLDGKIYPQKTLYMTQAQGILAGLIGYCISSTFLTQGFTWPFYIFFALSLALTQSIEAISSQNTNRL